ncbi:hypothetical protein AMTR_s00201p00009940 [Amborella trichopoda]|uniref:Uncharacterized protein n=1 Tax=Amborella trichopoda TaxID=13333 RepID=W1NLP4_AMBTC|nr:hypothetical protein AMTR_s00201p00009940 [Amborella trichopoda]
MHTKKRNRLEQKRLNNLVFVQYNQRQKEHHLKDLDPPIEWLVEPDVRPEPACEGESLHEVAEIGEGSGLGKWKGEEEGPDEEKDDDLGGHHHQIQVDCMLDVDLMLQVMTTLNLIIEFIIFVG